MNQSRVWMLGLIVLLVLTGCVSSVGSRSIEDQTSHDDGPKTLIATPSVIPTPRPAFEVPPTVDSPGFKVSDPLPIDCRRIAVSEVQSKVFCLDDTEESFRIYVVDISDPSQLKILGNWQSESKDPWWKFFSLVQVVKNGEGGEDLVVIWVPSGNRASSFIHLLSTADVPTLKKTWSFPGYSGRNILQLEETSADWLMGWFDGDGEMPRGGIVRFDPQKGEVVSKIDFRVFPREPEMGASSLFKIEEEGEAYLVVFSSGKGLRILPLPWENLVRNYPGVYENVIRYHPDWPYVLPQGMHIAGEKVFLFHMVSEHYMTPDGVPGNRIGDQLLEAFDKSLLLKAKFPPIGPYLNQLRIDVRGVPFHSEMFAERFLVTHADWAYGLIFFDVSSWPPQQTLWEADLWGAIVYFKPLKSNFLVIAHRKFGEYGGMRIVEIIPPTR